MSEPLPRRKRRGYVPRNAGGGGEAPDPGTIQPTKEVFAAQTAFLFSVVSANRGQPDMWQVLVQPVGGSGWAVAGSTTGKSTDITYSPAGVADAPMQLRVRVQLRKSSANYGQPPDITLVTVNP